MMDRGIITIRFWQVLAIPAAVIILFTIATCGGGGGKKNHETVTITGAVDDGSANTGANDSCSFVDDNGRTLATDTCDQNGAYQLQVPPDVTGYVLCGPKNMKSLNLSTAVSTVGMAAGETLPDELVTPTTTVAADIIRYENPSDLEARKLELLMQAQSNPDLKLVATIAGRLYRAMVAQNVNAQLGNGRGDGDNDSRGDSGGVGGDAGDGADFSPLSEARCSFVIGDDFSSAEQIYPAALADLLDGVFDRPDLTGLAEDVIEGETQERIREAFEAWFPRELWEELSTLSKENGEYFLPIPSNLVGYVRCVPKDSQKLALGTHIAGRSPGQVLGNQDVNPATTVFSALITPQLEKDLGTVKENFIADIDGLETKLVFENDSLTGFRVGSEAQPANSDVGLVAFSVTALFNTLYKNGLDVDFLAAIDALAKDQTVDDDTMTRLGVPKDEIPRLRAILDNSLDGGERDLGSDLAEAFSKARINVTVMGATDGIGLISGAVVTIENEDVICQGGCGQQTNSQGQLTLTLSGVAGSPATEISVVISSVDGFAPYAVTTEVVAFATVDLDIVLPSTNYNLSIQGAGDGSGAVTSAPGGIDCGTGSGAGGLCSATFASGSQVILTATPSASSVFDSWSGSCSGTDPTCIVSMDADAAVTARFTHGCDAADYTVSLDPTSFGSEGGTGTITVTAPDECSWHVSSSNPGWLLIPQHGSGSGDGNISYDVMENGEANSRAGTITFSNEAEQETHTVEQGCQLNAFYQDSDGDGYGDSSDSTQACTAPSGYVSNSRDCDDTNNAIHPAADEVCNGVDDDCDSSIDEGVRNTYYRDADGDGYGDDGNTVRECELRDGIVADNSDCDDNDYNINPSVREFCGDEIDNNCNGTIDENCLIDVNIDRDFEYIDVGWPMGLSVSQTNTETLRSTPYETLVVPPHFTPNTYNSTLYGYLTLGNSNDNRFSFAVNIRWADENIYDYYFYVDLNNNEDLTDDGEPFSNEGTGRLAALVSLDVDIVTIPGITITRPYRLWMWLDDTNNVRFYARCHYRGELTIGEESYTAVAFEYRNHDTLYRENGLYIDLNHDGELNRDTENFMNQETLTINGQEYELVLNYP